MKTILFSFLMALAVMLSGSDAVKASSFGFDPVNSTECLQKAIDSGAKKIRIDNTGKDWILEPIRLKSDQEIIIEAGVKIIAMAGKFHGRGDSLFLASKVRNITIRGEKGASIAMRKKDYQNKELYKHSEHRHTFRLMNCDDITIRDLDIRSSGGDGVYVSGDKDRNYSTNILLENLILDNHHRQGISIISVKGLTIRNCTISNTKGTAPECGIDFEPNQRDEFLENILVENCRFSKTMGDIVLATRLRTPCSITIRNCHMSNSYAGIMAGIFLSPEDPERAPPGFFRVENCVIENTRACAVRLRDHRTDMFELTLKNLTIHNPGGTAIQFWAEFPVSRRTGAAVLDNIVIEDKKNTGFLAFDTRKLPGAVLEKVSGDVVFNGEKFDVEQWIKQQRWDANEVLTDGQIADLQKLVPVGGAVEKEAPKKLKLRHDFRYLFACRKGVPVAFELELISVGKRSPTLDNLILTGPDGSRQWLELLATGEKLHHRFTPRADGIYYLDVDTRNMVMTLTPQENCIWSITPLPEKRSGARYLQSYGSPQNSRLYFQVPTGVKEFRISAFGKTKAIVEDSSGKAVMEIDNPGQDTIYTLKRESGKAEIWSILIKSSTAGLRMIEPLSPVFSLEKRNLLIGN